MLFPDLPEVPKPSETRSVREELRRTALDAVKVLRSAMHGDGDMVVVRAACAVLDRAGFGPHTTVAVEDNRDLSRLTTEQLFERAERLRRAIEEQMTGAPDPPSVH